jgi:hypothetical protein
MNEAERSSGERQEVKDHAPQTPFLNHGEDTEQMGKTFKASTFFLDKQ